MKIQVWKNMVLAGTAVLLMAAGSLVCQAQGTTLEDGDYLIEVTLQGGSGRAGVESPVKLTVEHGSAVADLLWSSPYFDYMLVDGEKYEPVNEDGNSEFLIPIKEFDCEIPVTADTTAMSTPHEVEYTLEFVSASITAAEPAGEADRAGASQTAPEKPDGEPGTTEAAAEKREAEQTEAKPDKEKPDSETEKETAGAASEVNLETVEAAVLPGLEFDHRLPLEYAQKFMADYYKDGYVLITIPESGRYLIVPEGMPVPDGLEQDITVLPQPIQNIYLVATSAMDFFAALGGLDRIGLSGTKADGWYVNEARVAMEEGTIRYAGKYSTPDYEQIVAAECGLAVESTMIYHTPEVKEKLEEFGIPVLVERSSYEAHPLGRAEWIKLYGILLEREEEAQTLFEEQAAKLKRVESQQNTGKTVAFFYLNSNGYANVRESGDYVAKMIELAGGTYIFQDLGSPEDSLSTVNMSLEEFYAGAKDADYIIYNSTIDGEIGSVSELLKKSQLLADFKAVKEGKVWCTTQNLFQKTTGLADMIVDIHTMLSSENPKEETYTYLYPMTEEQ